MPPRHGRLMRVTCLLIKATQKHVPWRQTGRKKRKEYRGQSNRGLCATPHTPARRATGAKPDKATKSCEPIRAQERLLLPSMHPHTQTQKSHPASPCCTLPEKATCGTGCKPCQAPACLLHHQTTPLITAHPCQKGKGTMRQPPKAGPQLLGRLALCGLSPQVLRQLGAHHLAGPFVSTGTPQALCAQPSCPTTWQGSLSCWGSGGHVRRRSPAHGSAHGPPRAHTASPCSKAGGWARGKGRGQWQVW